LLLLLLVVALAVFAPLLPYDAYRQNILHRNEVPSLKHWLGTDELGRDMVARIAVGARVSLIVAVTATLIAAAIGVMVGTLSAYIGGVTDGVLMRFVDSMYAFPDTLFAILMAALIKGQLGSHISGFSHRGGPQIVRGLLGVLLTLGLTG
jgi:ABC-type dipeptide/oligopeptide/nickel transport system permease subunit